MSEQEYLFTVKLDKWSSPVKITAKSALEATNRALERFPACDCCDEPTRVENVSYLETMPEIR